MSNLLERSTAPGASSADGHRPKAIEMLPTRDAKLGGGLKIRRALPQRARRLVGAWCFLDHFGPLDLGGGRGLRVGPHPHIGLQTATWVLEGEVLHRDGLGSVQLIRPGQLNLMTAGRGIAHSEETPAAHGPRLHGLQLWIALPERERDREASFEHHPALPAVERDGLRATLVAGAAFGERSPARIYSPLVGIDLESLDAGRRALALDPDFEHGVLVTQGALSIDGRSLRPGTLCYLGPGRTRIELANTDSFRAFLLGGRPFGEAILLWWNFVARSRAEIATARREWETHSPRFAAVDGYPGPRLDAPDLTPGIRPR